MKQRRSGVNNGFPGKIIKKSCLSLFTVGEKKSVENLREEEKKW